MKQLTGREPFKRVFRLPKNIAQPSVTLQHTIHQHGAYEVKRDIARATFSLRCKADRVSAPRQRGGTSLLKRLVREETIAILGQPVETGARLEWNAIGRQRIAARQFVDLSFHLTSAIYPRLFAQPDKPSATLRWPTIGF